MIWQCCKSENELLFKSHHTSCIALSFSLVLCSWINLSGILGFLFRDSFIQSVRVLADAMIKTC